MKRMKHRRIRGCRGNTKGAELRRARVRYMRRCCRRSVRKRRFALLFCAALAAGYLLLLSKQSGRIFELEAEKQIEGQEAEGQLSQTPEERKGQFGIIFRLKNGEITFYRESSY